MKKILAALVVAAFAGGVALTSTAALAKAERPAQQAGANKVVKKTAEKAAPQKRRIAKSKRPVKPARAA